MNLHKSKRALPKGFTILEVLISMIIVALVLTIVYSAFSAGSRVCKFGSQRAQIFHSARLAMQDIIQSIENLEFGTNDYYRFLGEAHSGSSAGKYSVDADELEFATTTKPTFINERWHAGLARVRYVLNSDTTTGDTILEKWVAEVDDEDFKDAYVLELSKNIVGMTFRYLSDDDYKESWDSDDKDDKEKLPEVVEITFYIKEGDEVIPFRSGALIPNMVVGEKMKSVKSTRSTKNSQRPNTMPGGAGTTIPKPVKRAPAK